MNLSFFEAFLVLYALQSAGYIQSSAKVYQFGKVLSGYRVLSPRAFILLKTALFFAYSLNFLHN
jgi:hypothetical protein